MTKQELIKRIHATAAQYASQQMRKADVEAVIDALAFEIQAMPKGEKITVPGIGTFSTKVKAARKGRNPKTGEALDIPAKNVPHFSAATVLKEAVAG